MVDFDTNLLNFKTLGTEVSQKSSKSLFLDFDDFDDF